MKLVVNVTLTMDKKHFLFWKLFIDLRIHFSQKKKLDVESLKHILSVLRFSKHFTTENFNWILLPVTFCPFDGCNIKVYTVYTRRGNTSIILSKNLQFILRQFIIRFTLLVFPFLCLRTRKTKFLWSHRKNLVPFCLELCSMLFLIFFSSTLPRKRFCMPSFSSPFTSLLLSHHIFHLFIRVDVKKLFSNFPVSFVIKKIGQVNIRLFSIHKFPPFLLPW